MHFGWRRLETIFSSLNVRENLKYGRISPPCEDGSSAWENAEGLPSGRLSAVSIKMEDKAAFVGFFLLFYDMSIVS